jgi:glycosyltransferase involved in cell wall biosynthesis
MISFVIPVYKKPAEQFNRAVKSLLDMSVKDIEVIAVFDGSDPILESHAEKWTEKDKRFKHIVISHAGACAARNAGSDIAKGEYIAAWDADCYAEPEMADVWLETFRNHPECDFVYSGYKFVNQEKDSPGFESEPFDPWTLNHYNYIASMFPIKREKFPRWDESLEGLQDWDFWRRAVANGCKGQLIPGYGFWTEIPDEKSISGQTAKRIERIRKVREKHEDVTPEILVHGQTFRRNAIVLAKTLGADYFNLSDYWATEDYKVIITMGLHPWELIETSGLFQRAKPGTKKVIYWTGYDADNFAMSPYVQTRALMNGINKEITKNYATDERTLGILEDLGIQNAELLIFPREEGVPATTLPEKFKVLAWADTDHIVFVKGLQSAMPDVDFEIVKENTYYDINDYSVALQFTNAGKMEMATRNALMMGRYCISNVQAPYSGFVDTENVTKFKDEVISKIREYQNIKEINSQAQEYYLKESDPETFKQRIKDLIRPTLEAV